MKMFSYTGEEYNKTALDSMTDSTLFKFLLTT